METIVKGISGSDISSISDELQTRFRHFWYEKKTSRDLKRMLTQYIGSKLSIKFGDFCGDSVDHSEGFVSYYSKQKRQQNKARREIPYEFIEILHVLIREGKTSSKNDELRVSKNIDLFVKFLEHRYGYQKYYSIIDDIIKTKTRLGKLLRLAYDMCKRINPGKEYFHWFTFAFLDTHVNFSYYSHDPLYDKDDDHDLYQKIPTDFWDELTDQIYEKLVNELYKYIDSVIHEINIEFESSVGSSFVDVKNLDDSTKKFPTFPTQNQSYPRHDPIVHSVSIIGSRKPSIKFIRRHKKIAKTEVNKLYWEFL
jgi:predicted transcriptional regulator